MTTAQPPQTPAETVQHWVTEQALVSVGLLVLQRLFHSCPALSSRRSARQVRGLHRRSAEWSRPVGPRIIGKAYPLRQRMTEVACNTPGCNAAPESSVSALERSQVKEYTLWLTREPLSTLSRSSLLPLHDRYPSAKCLIPGVQLTRHSGLLGCSRRGVHLASPQSVGGVRRTFNYVHRLCFNAPWSVEPNTISSM